MKVCEKLIARLIEDCETIVVPMPIADPTMRIEADPAVFFVTAYYFPYPSVTMPRVSAGLLMYRFRDGKLQVFLAHPGGPFYTRKDDGAWSIPKGEPDPDEALLDAAMREFEEETGIKPAGPFVPLTPIKQKGGKRVHAWAFEGDWDGTAIVSNSFAMEWPPKSGRQAEFPEIDRAEFFDVPVAKRKAKGAQVALIEELEHVVGERGE